MAAGAARGTPRGRMSDMLGKLLGFGHRQGTAGPKTTTIEVELPDEPAHSPWCCERAALRLLQAIEEADAVLVGAGAGLSTSAGFTYAGERFERWFSDFEEAYGYHDMYAGGFYPYDTLEEHWAFWSRYIYCNRFDQPAGQAYLDLLELVGKKDYFVLTTNVDHRFQVAGFDKHRLFYTQGDYGLFQCSEPCCQETWDNEEQVRAMLAEQRDLRIPSELVPRCPHCGRPAAMNLRSDGTFVEDAGWHRAAERYQEFLQRHQGMRVLYLELGVGGNTPAIIKYPFWRMTAQNPSATYACINKGEAFTPRELSAQSLVIDGDIGEVLAAALALRGSEGCKPGETA